MILFLVSFVGCVARTRKWVGTFFSNDVLVVVHGQDGRGFVPSPWRVTVRIETVRAFECRCKTSLNPWHGGISLGESNTHNNNTSNHHNNNSNDNNNIIITMPPPRPPSRIEPLSFPVFSMSWWADPADGTSMIVYGGGGGSAKTGVPNTILVELFLGPSLLQREAAAAAATTSTTTTTTTTSQPAPNDHEKSSSSSSSLSSSSWGDAHRRFQISTGDLVADAVKVYQVQSPSSSSPSSSSSSSLSLSRNIFCFAGLSNQVNRYHLPSGRLVRTLYLPEGEEVRALTVNALGNELAVGCESGKIFVYAIHYDKDDYNNINNNYHSNNNNTDQPTTPSPFLYSCALHTKSVCALDFSIQGGRLISSAKDGTGLIWDHARGGQFLAGFQCSVTDPQDPPPKRPPGQVVVRGCAFIDWHGRVAIVAASGRRGKSFVSQWEEQTVTATPAATATTATPTTTASSQEQPAIAFKCTARFQCSTHPISSMSVSQDGKMLALGDADGSIHLYQVDQLHRARKVFFQVHDLPVAALAARPFAVPLQGEDEDGVQVHCRSATADSQVACLTLQRRARRQQRDRHGASESLHGMAVVVSSWMTVINRIVYVLIVIYLLSPVWKEAHVKCGQAVGWGSEWQSCLVQDFLWAPPTRPGVSSPPY